MLCKELVEDIGRKISWSSGCLGHKWTFEYRSLLGSGVMS